MATWHASNFTTGRARAPEAVDKLPEGNSTEPWPLQALYLLHVDPP